MKDVTILKLSQWITHAGLAGLSELSLVQEFCRRAVEAGVPLSRGMIGVDTLHPVLEGRRRTSLLPGHRRANQRKQPARHPVPSVTASVARRPLSFYDQVARRLAEAGRTA